jgi:heptosyltransferase-1
MRVLIVKISSMGDLIHALPAVTDAAKAIPGIQFDWVVEKGFSEIPLWHPNVNQVITSSHRIWKKKLWQSVTHNEFIQFVKKLRFKKYDLVIDAQSSVKSAIVTLLARGVRAGMDHASVREWGAHWVYQKKGHVPKKQHAIERLRQLFAQALGYPYSPSLPDAGLRAEQFLMPSLQLATPYLVFIHHTSWPSKCWPENHWRALIQIANSAGYTVLFPWGSDAEKQRAESLVEQQTGAQVLPALSLTEMAGVFAKASGVIGCDTGLGHLAAALAIPTLILYGPTDPELIGVSGERQLALQSTFECTLCYKRKCHFKAPVSEKEKPVCLSQISPEAVWQQFLPLTFR